jgi:hypothetical protein
LCLVSIWYKFLGFGSVGADVCVLLDVILFEHLCHYYDTTELSQNVRNQVPSDALFYPRRMDTKNILYHVFLLLFKPLENFRAVKM